MKYILYHMAKIYQQEIDKIKKKIFQYIRHLNMNKADRSKFLSYITNIAKDKETREKLKYFFLSVIENRNKKSKDFQTSVKKFKNDENYKFIDPLIERHFLFKAVQELNEEVVKNKEGILVDFTDRIYEYFRRQTMLYCKRKGFYNEDGDLDEDTVNKEFNYIEQVIKQHTNDEEFIPWIKKLETNLPTSYIDIPC